MSSADFDTLLMTPRLRRAAPQPAGTPQTPGQQHASSPNPRQLPPFGRPHAAHTPGPTAQNPVSTGDSLSVHTAARLTPEEPHPARWRSGDRPRAAAVDARNPRISRLSVGRARFASRAGNQEPNDTPSALLKLLICRILSVSAQVRSMQKSAECAVRLGNPVGGRRRAATRDWRRIPPGAATRLGRRAPGSPFRRRGNSRLVVRSSTLGRIARRAHGRNVFVIARTRRSS